MGSSGLEYVQSKEGLIKLAIIVCGAVAFGLVAASGHGGVLGWVLAAYVISWCFTLLSFFFIVTTLSTKMQCGVAYEAVDVCLTVFGFFHCLMASIVLCMYAGHYHSNRRHNGERIAACVFGFILAILYAIEGYFNKGDAPGNLGFLWTKNGILKSVIVILGCTAFALLDAGGYQHWPQGSIDSARTWVFAAYIISWLGSVIILLLHVTELGSKISVFGTIDFAWSAFSFLHYLVASIVLASYLECVSFDWFDCSARLASDIFGFITAILYLVDAFLLKGNASGISPKPTDVKT